jgi:hypothetical protein
MHGKDLAGAPVKIGFAKVPSMGASPSVQSPNVQGDIYAAALPPPARIPSLWGTQSHEYAEGSHSTDGIYYAPSLLTLPEPAADRKIDNVRMREYRKRLESPAISDEQFNEIFNIVLMDAVTASAGRQIL